jgi:hypothetical protein
MAGIVVGNLSDGCPVGVRFNQESVLWRAVHHRRGLGASFSGARRHEHLSRPLGLLPGRGGRAGSAAVRSTPPGIDWALEVDAT